MSSQYIDVPIVTDPRTLAQLAFDYLQNNIEGWEPSEGQLDVIQAEALARQLAELMAVASKVPTSIFRYFGLNVILLNPINAAPASAPTTWTMRDNAGYTIPAGTTVALRVTGDLRVLFQTADAVLIAPGDTVTDTGAVTIVAVEAGLAASGLNAPVELVTPLDFVESITLESQTSGGVDGETDAAYLNRLVAYLRLLAPRPILPGDFSQMALNVPGVARALAIDLYNPNPNLLTAVQSSFEDGTHLGWTAFGGATLADATDFAAHGSHSLKLTATATQDMGVESSSIAVEPSTQYTVLCSFRPGSVAEGVYLGVKWYDSADVLISGPLYTPEDWEIAGQWRQVSFVVASPAGAAKCHLLPTIAATNGRVHEIDTISLRKGRSFAWSLGGLPATNNERMVTVAIVDALGGDLGSTVKAAAKAYLESHRETTFVVNIIGPSYTQVDVHFEAVATRDGDPGAIQAAAIAAIQSYLSPANWGLSPNVGDLAVWLIRDVVRRNELIALVDRVQGIDYVTALTLAVHGNSLGTADISLSGVAPLSQPGTVTGAVSAP